MLDGKIPGTSAKAVFSKVFIDQVLWNPCFGVMFFSYVALLEAKGRRPTRRRHPRGIDPHDWRP